MFNRCLHKITPRKKWTRLKRKGLQKTKHYLFLFFFHKLNPNKYIFLICNKYYRLNSTNNNVIIFTIATIFFFFFLSVQISVLSVPDTIWNINILNQVFCVFLFNPNTTICVQNASEVLLVSVIAYSLYNISLLNNDDTVQRR